MSHRIGTEKIFPKLIQSSLNPLRVFGVSHSKHLHRNQKQLPPLQHSGSANKHKQAAHLWHLSCSCLIFALQDPSRELHQPLLKHVRPFPLSKLKQLVPPLHKELAHLLALRACALLTNLLSSSLLVLGVVLRHLLL